MKSKRTDICLIILILTRSGNSDSEKWNNLSKFPAWTVLSPAVASTTVWCNLVPLSCALSPLKPGSRSLKLTNMKQESNSYWYSDKKKTSLPMSLLRRARLLTKKRALGFDLAAHISKPVFLSPQANYFWAEEWIGFRGGNLNNWSVSSSFSFNNKEGTAGLLGINRASRT